MAWSLVLVVALLLAGSRGVPNVEPTSGVAMIGGDGLTSWYSDGTSTASATWARIRGGLTMATSGPDALGWWVVLTKTDQATTDLARFSWAIEGSSPAPGDEVFSLTNGEVRRELVSAGGLGRIYATGRLELPADARSGSAWTGEGLVVTQTDGIVGDPQPYTSQGKATTPADPALAAEKCLDVTVDETVDGAVDSTSRTWCPNRGIVRFSLGSRVFSAAAAPDRQVPTSAAAFPWDQAADLRSSTVTWTPRGTSLISPTFVARPGVLSSGVLVAALKQANDIVAIDPAGATGNLDRTVWRAHPGGVIQTCVTLGDMTVVTTSERRVVAYGPSGVALWTASLPDTAGRAAVAFGAHVVVATVDGTVQALSSVTGQRVWKASLPSEVRLQPAVSGDTLVAIDETGTMVALGADGGELWRTSDLPVETFTISGGVVVTAERGATALRGYHLATGTKLWRAWEPALIRSLADVDGVAVANSVAGVKGFDPASGAALWTHQETQLDLTAVGGRVALVTSDSVVVLDRAGREAARWPHGLARLPTLTVHLVTGSDVVLAITMNQIFRGVLR